MNCFSASNRLSAADAAWGMDREGEERRVGRNRMSSRSLTKRAIPTACANWPRTTRAPEWAKAPLIAPHPDKITKRDVVTHICTTVSRKSRS